MKVYAEVLQVKEECSGDGIVCTAVEKKCRVVSVFPQLHKGVREMFLRKRW
jgi:hypothetical protein